MPTQVKVGWRSFVSPVTSSYLLDTYTGAAAAYSLRKLRTAYTGSAIRVRRSSDNGEQNIGFDSGGNLDTTSLLAFVGAGNGFVTTWYDQSGNGSNLIQATAAAQMRIVGDGVIDTLNGKPALTSNYNYAPKGWYKATYSSSISNPATMFNIGSNSQSGGATFLWSGFNSEMYLYSYWTDWFRIGGSAEFTLQGYLQNINTQRIINAIYNGASSKIRVNNGAYTTGNTGTATATGLTLGSTYISLGYAAAARYQEHIVFPTNQESNATNINANINSYYSIYSTLDTDAQAFVTAAAITDSTQVSAVNTLVTQLKTAGVWTKMKALYPFVGGSAASHKWNLKDPRDLDAAYRLVFNGGSTHNSTGYVPNLNSYADTKLNPSAVLSIDSAHFSYYSRTNTLVDNYDMGVATTNTGTNLLFNAALRWGDGLTYYSMCFNPVEISKIQTSTNKNFIFNKLTTSSSLFENTTKTTTSVTNRSGLPNANFFIAARNLNGTVQQSSQRNCAFASIGDGLTDAEATALYTAVQAFQTTLGRQV